MAARYCSSVCGRYTLASPAETVVACFGLDDAADVPELAPRYNIAPTQAVAAVRALPGQADDPGAEPKRVLEMRRWGLVPPWAKAIAGPALFNARSETLPDRPAFRSAYRRQRCLIPADGFYEWRTVSGRRLPFHIRRVDRRPFAMAGLHACWRPATGDPIESCTIVTTRANALLAPLHDRMPVILSPEAWRAWLDPRTEDTASLSELLRPAEASGWVAYAVDPRVNRARHDVPANVEPLFDESPPIDVPDPAAR